MIGRGRERSIADVSALSGANRATPTSSRHQAKHLAMIGELLAGLGLGPPGNTLGRLFR